MEIFNRFKIWKFSKTRIEAFSDAVFAIVITLLVLELKLPDVQHPEDTHEILEKLRGVAPIFFSWAVSFFFVALIWLHHHQIMYMVNKSDYGVIWINTFLLFFISLLPFPTKLMGEYPRQPLIVSFWGLTVCATTAVLTWFYYYNTKNYLRNTFDKTSVMRNVRLSLLAGPLLYLAASLLAWVSVYIAYAIFVFVPVLYILPLDKEQKNGNDDTVME